MEIYLWYQHHCFITMSYLNCIWLFYDVALGKRMESKDLCHIPVYHPLPWLGTSTCPSFQISRGFDQCPLMYNRQSQGNKRTNQTYPLTNMPSGARLLLILWWKQPPPPPQQPSAMTTWSQWKNCGSAKKGRRMLRLCASVNCEAKNCIYLYIHIGILGSYLLIGAIVFWEKNE